jgi:hypothetical protein
MKKLMLLLVLAGTLFTQAAHAQDFTNAGQYLDYINKQGSNIAKKFLSYNSAASHGKRAKKVENLRKQLLDEVAAAQENIGGMPSFGGDKELRDTAYSFMKLYYNVLDEDYAKIVNMEEISEQSYDNMEAYMLLQEVVDKKLQDANDQLQAVEKKFAAAHNINLLSTQDDISVMMDKVEKVNKYYHNIYLVFFRSFKEEAYLLDAISNKNIAGIEQDKNALLQYAQKGLTSLDTSRAFEGDNSLITSCRTLLRFYVNEVTTKMNTVSDYFLKSEQFTKIKATYDASSDHSQADVDNYNKAVKDLNDAVNAYNNMTNQLNPQRNDLVNDWNNTVNTFFDQNMPKYK